MKLDSSKGKVKIRPWTVASEETMRRWWPSRPKELSEALTGKIVARSLIDENFRKQLLSDPHPIFEFYGLSIPKGYAVKVVEGPGGREEKASKKTIFIKLPPPPKFDGKLVPWPDAKLDLTDKELTSVREKAIFSNDNWDWVKDFFIDAHDSWYGRTGDKGSVDKDTAAD